MTTAPIILMVLALMAIAQPVSAEESEPETQTETEAKPDALKPGPWLFMRQQVAVAGFPAGLISDTRLQLRGPMHRDNSIVFQETYGGVGAKVAVTPAFVEVGPRLSLAPIDIFDVDFQASYIGYWPSSSGLLPYDTLDESTRDKDREVRWNDPELTAESGHALMVSAAPTLKLKIGPIIGFSGWTFAYYWFQRAEGQDSPLLYEPYWDRLMQPNDMVIEHQAAIVSEFLNGKKKPLLWVGATYVDRRVINSKDKSMMLGGLVLFQPSYKEGWPKFLVQVTPYIKDTDRVGRAPFMALALVWTKDLTLKQAAGM